MICFALSPFRQLLVGFMFVSAGTCLVALPTAEGQQIKAPAAKLTAVKPANAPQQVARRKEASQKKVAKNVTGPQTQMRALVEQSLAKNPYYTPGQLISRRDAETIFQKLRELNLTTPEDQEDLGGALLPDQSFLVTRLKTPAGRAFMKKIADDKTAYERLERLSWTSDGRRLIDGFINSKDGPAKFQELKTAAQLAKVSKQLAADPRTVEFELPTGHVHTAAGLIAKLEEVLERQKSAE